MQKFRGAVKPHIKIEGLGLTVKYGEEVDLADWQVAHKHFEFAFRNGWVISIGKKTLTLGPVETRDTAPPKEQIEATSETNKLLADIAGQQQKLIELIQKGSTGHVSAPEASPNVEMVSLLKDIKMALQNGKPQVAYNKENGGAAKEGFKVQDFEEKYVPKIEDFDVKSSKITTQESASGGTDDALAALKSLRQQKKAKES